MKPCIECANYYLNTDQEVREKMDESQLECSQEYIHKIKDKCPLFIRKVR